MELFSARLCSALTLATHYRPVCGGASARSGGMLHYYCPGLAEVCRGITKSSHKTGEPFGRPSTTTTRHAASDWTNRCPTAPPPTRLAPHPNHSHATTYRRGPSTEQRRRRAEPWDTHEHRSTTEHFRPASTTAMTLRDRAQPCLRNCFLPEKVWHPSPSHQPRTRLRHQQGARNVDEAFASGSERLPRLLVGPSGGQGVGRSTQYRCPFWSRRREFVHQRPLFTSARARARSLVP